jgi:endonuclease YncB( thermonuclease family)
MKEREELKYFNNETPLFSLNGIKTYVRVVNVTDGDTISVVIPIFDNYFKFHVRLNGIDTCEIHSKNEIIKDRGLKAKYRLIELLCPFEKLNNILCTTKKQIIDLFDKNICLIWLECLDFDKYGRLLGNIYIDNKLKNVSNILIEEKLAYKYDGTTKLNEEEQMNM